MAAVKANVVDPSVEVQVWECLLEGVQDGLRAWRLDLDLDDNGTVTFVEFSNQCRRLGFQGRVRQIWTSLRPLDDRALEFAELAPDESEHVEKFADLIWNAPYLQGESFLM
eukprot:g3856.t1